VTTATATKPKPRPPAKAKAPAPTPDPQPVLIHAGELADLLADASLFASLDTARPLLTYVKLEVTKGTVIARSTDSYCLVEITEKIDSPDRITWTRYVGPQWRAVLVTALRIHARSNDPVAATLRPHGTWGLEVSVPGFSVEVGESGTTTTGVAYPDFAPLWRMTEGAHDPADDERIVSLDARFTAKQAKIFAASKKFAFGATPVVWTFRGQLKPVEWRIGGTVRGLIMPMRPH
jgi:hypothetical protein